MNVRSSLIVKGVKCIIVLGICAFQTCRLAKRRQRAEHDRRLEVERQLTEERTRRIVAEVQARRELALAQKLEREIRAERDLRMQQNVALAFQASRASVLARDTAIQHTVVTAAAMSHAARAYQQHKKLERVLIEKLRNALEHQFLANEQRNAAVLAHAASVIRSQTDLRRRLAAERNRQRLTKLELLKEKQAHAATLDTLNNLSQRHRDVLQRLVDAE